MGHLLSRAYRRITQLGGSRASHSQQEERQPDQNQPRAEQHGDRSISQSIPVGQSIDSAEYVGLAAAKKASNGEQPHSTVRQTMPSKETSVVVTPPVQDENNLTNNTPKEQLRHKDKTVCGDEDKHEAEEAAIKIQAYVRGHLTRKALKDAHQQKNNSLGQSQFDEESLTRNPPCAVFLPSSPLSASSKIGAANVTSNLATLRHQHDQRGLDAGISESVSKSPILESIAEDLETQQIPSVGLSDAHENESSPTPPSTQTEQQKPTQLDTRSPASPPKLDMPANEDCLTKGSVSPVPSEANASIDLGSPDSPTSDSASIDIQDHNIKPTDRIATVLHHRKRSIDSVVGSEQRVSSPTHEETLEMQPTATSMALATASEGCEEAFNHQIATMQPTALITPDVNECSEEAAAIRIQSAFRGYRTRKNSPYRTRSPTAPALSENSPNRRTMLKQKAIASSYELGDEGEEDMAKTNDLQYGDHTIQSIGIHGTQNLDDKTGTIEQMVSSGASLEELTASEAATVQEANFSNPDLGATEKGRQVSSDANNAVAKQLEASDSLDIEGGDFELAHNASAALEGVEGISLEDSVARINSLATRPSLSGKSEASCDTDSSALGAALSLHEDSISSNPATIEPQVHQQEQNQGAQHPALEPIDEDKSLGVSTNTDDQEYEARRLLDSGELGANLVEQADCDVLSAQLTQPSESFDEEDLGGAISALAAQLDEDEQRVIELESDDIERRDPRGQVSEERAKSPQIKTDAPPFSEELSISSAGGHLLVDEESSNQDEGTREARKKKGESSDETMAAEGECSSPALASSNGDSQSSNGDDDEQNSEHDELTVDGGEKEQALRQSPTQQKQNQQQQSAGKHKKRNRNKKKGKK